MHGNSRALSLIEWAEPDIIGRDSSIFDWETRIDAALADFSSDLADCLRSLLEGNGVFHFVEPHGAGAGEDLVTPANLAWSRHRT